MIDSHDGARQVTRARLRWESDGEERDPVHAQAITGRDRVGLGGDVE